MSFNFKRNYSLEDRKKESIRVMQKHADRVPVICEKNERASSFIPQVDKYKYLVPNDLTIGQFIYVIRKRIHLTPEQAIYLFIDGIIPQSNEMLYSIYHKHKDKDGFLYISYTNENTFGR
jgi:GABA(A) receptor-associated protein